MSRLHTFLTPSPRTMLVFAALLAATLLAAATLVQPPTRGDAVHERADGADRASGLAQGSAVAPAVDGAGSVEGSAPPAAGIGATEEAAARDAGSSGRIGSTLPTLDARIARTGALQLRVRRGTFDEAWSHTALIAAAVGGSVASASRSGSGTGTSSGTITLRVPSDRFDATVERLRGIDGTHVMRLDVSSQDVTEEFVDVRSRLRHGRAVEGRLLALLARADRVNEVLAVQARLDQVQEQVEVSRGRMQYLEQATSFSTIAVDLRERQVAADRDRRGVTGVLADAWTDSRARFAASVAAAMVWAGGALPALIVLAIVGIVVRRVVLGRAAGAASEGSSGAADRAS